MSLTVRGADDILLVVSEVNEDSLTGQLGGALAPGPIEVQLEGAFRDISEGGLVDQHPVQVVC